MPHTAHQTVKTPETADPILETARDAGAEGAYDLDKEEFMAVVALNEERAINLLPEVRDPNSDLSKEMIRINNELQRTNNPLFNDPRKPLTLAAMAKENLDHKPQEAATSSNNPVEDKPTVSIIGPFERSKVKVDGFIVPRIDIVQIEGTEKSLMLIVDEQFCVPCSEKEVEKWVPIIAHAMAVAEGFTCHGGNSQLANPYKARAVSLGTVQLKPKSDADHSGKG